MCEFDKKLTRIAGRQPKAAPKPALRQRGVPHALHTSPDTEPQFGHLSAESRSPLSTLLSTSAFSI
jgi:hypothetical protein